MLLMLFSTCQNIALIFFSFFVFALVKCIICFSFSGIRQRVDIKTNCFFKNYIWRSIFNYSLLFRIFSEFLSCNHLSHETYIDYQTTQTGSRARWPVAMRWD